MFTAWCVCVCLLVCPSVCLCACACDCVCVCLCLLFSFRGFSMTVTFFKCPGLYPFNRCWSGGKHQTKRWLNPLKLCSPGTQISHNLGTPPLPGGEQCWAATVKDSSGAVTLGVGPQHPRYVSGHCYGL